MRRQKTVQNLYEKVNTPCQKNDVRDFMAFHGVSSLLIHSLTELLRSGSSKPDFFGNLHLGIHFFTIHADECDVVFIFG